MVLCPSSFLAMVALYGPAIRAGVAARFAFESQGNQSGFGPEDLGQVWCKKQQPALTSTGTWSFHKSSETCSCTCAGEECFMCELGLKEYRPDESGLATCRSRAECSGDNVVPDEDDRYCIRTIAKTIAPCGSSGTFDPQTETCKMDVNCPKPETLGIEYFAPTWKVRCHKDPQDADVGELVGEVEMTVNQNDITCTYKRRFERPETKVVPATCLPGSTLVSNECQVAIDCPPPVAEIQITNADLVLACGPKQDLYINLMLDLMRKKAVALQQIPITQSTPYNTPDRYKIRMSCEATCASVWAKITECGSEMKKDIEKTPQEEGWKSCVGSHATTGVTYVDWSAITTEQKNNGFRKLKNAGQSKAAFGGGGTKTGCGSIFTSETTFEGEEFNAVCGKVRELAKNKYLSLGSNSMVDAGKKTIKSLSCRAAYCEKVMKKGGDSKELCFDSCKTFHPLNEDEEQFQAA